jgi:hypothetical protein
VVSVGLHVQQPQKPSQFLPLLPSERFYEKANVVKPTWRL